MPKDNEVDEKVRPVAWIVTNGGESCEPWLEYEQSEVDALPAVCIAEPLYSAATVAELRAEVERLQRELTLANGWNGDPQVSARTAVENANALTDIQRQRADAAERRAGELEADARRYRQLKRGRGQPFGDTFIVKKFNRTFGEEEGVSWSDMEREIDAEIAALTKESP